MANINIETILLKRGNTAHSSTYTGPLGELVIDTDLHTVRVQDNINPGGHLLTTASDFGNLSSNVANLTAVVTSMELYGNANVADYLAQFPVTAIIPDYITTANIYGITGNGFSGNVGLFNSANTGGIRVETTGAITFQTPNHGLQINQYGELVLADVATPIVYANGQSILTGLSGGGGSTNQLVAGSYTAYLNASDGKFHVPGYIILPNGEIRTADDGGPTIDAALTTQGVTISSHATQNKWYFGPDGGLTLPDGSNFGNGGWNTTNGIALVNHDTDFSLSSVVMVEASGQAMLHSQNDSGTIQLTVKTDSLNNVITIVNNTETWTFGTNGQITIPQGGVIGDTYSDGHGIGLGAGPNSGDYAGINSHSGAQYVETNETAVYIGTNYPVGGGNTWTFDKLGGITFPDNTRQTTAWSGQSANVGNVAPTTGTGSLWYDTTDGRMYANIGTVWVDANPTVAPAPSFYLGNITIDDGNVITFPGGTLTVDSTGNLLVNGSQVTGSGGGSTYGNANVALLLSAFGSNTITTTGTVAVGAMNIPGSITWTPGNGSTIYEDSGLIVQGAISVDITSPGSTEVTAGSYNYYFDNAGVLTLPNSISFSSTTVGAPGSAGGNRINLYPGQYQYAIGIDSATTWMSSANSIKLYAGSDSWTFNNSGQFIVPGSIIANSADGTQAIVFSPDSGSTNNGYLNVDSGGNMLASSSSGFIVKISGNDRLNVYASDTTITAGNDLYLKSNKNSSELVWKLGHDGNITLPTNSAAINYANGVSILNGIVGGAANTGDITFLGNDIIGLGTNVTITADTTNWIFDATGNIVFPDNSVQTTAYVPVTPYGNANVASYLLGNISTGNIAVYNSITATATPQVGTLITGIEQYNVTTDNGDGTADITWLSSDTNFVNQVWTPYCVGAPDSIVGWILTDASGGTISHIVHAWTNGPQYTLVTDNYGAGAGPFTLRSPDYVASTPNPLTITSNNYSWGFGSTGALTFPDNSTQTTAYTGYSNSNVAAYLSGNITVGNFTISGAPPATRSGNVGDTAGMIRVDSNYLYYCTSNYVPSSYTVNWSGSVGNILFIPKGAYPDPQVGWTVAYSTYTFTISAVQTYGGDSSVWEITFGGSGVSSPSGGTATLTNPNPPVIWETVPLGTFKTPFNTSVTNYLTTYLPSYSGNLTAGNLTISGNITYVGNAIVQNIQTGNFTGNVAGFGAIYAGIVSGYSYQPQTVIQASTNFNDYAQINHQNINSGTRASTDFVATADIGNGDAGFIDMGINSSGFVGGTGNELNYPLDGYLLVTGTASNNGNLLITTDTAADVVISTNGQGLANQQARFKSNVGLILYRTTPSTSTTTGALQVAGGVGIQGSVYAGNIYANNFLYANGVNILSTVSGGSGTYSNASVVAMLSANTAVFIGNTGVIGNVATGNIQANTTAIFLGANTVISNYGSPTFGYASHIGNNIYFDANGVQRYRNTQTGASDLIVGPGTLYWYATGGAVTANTATGYTGASGAYMAMSTSGMSLYNGAGITSAGPVTIQSATGLVTNQSSFALLNGTATTVNFAGAATTLNIGSAAGSALFNGNLYSYGNIGNNTGNISVRAQGTWNNLTLYGIAGGYSNSTNQALTGGSGTGMTANYSTTGGYINTITMSNPGSGYKNGDILTVSGGLGSTVILTNYNPNYSGQGVSNWLFGMDGNIAIPAYANIVSNGTTILSTLNGTSSITVTGNVSTTGQLISKMGTANTDSQLILQGNVYKGGAGYHDFMRITSTYSGVTNPNKYLRLDNAGSLQILNSGYSASLFTLTDAGDTTISGNLTVSGINSGYAPNRPAFRVMGSGGTPIAATANVTSSNFTVDYNQGGYLNTTTGFFVAPVAGLYQVCLVARTSSNTNSGIIQAVIQQNYNGGNKNVIMIEYGTNTSINHTGGSTIVKMAVGDSLQMRVLQGSVNFDANDNWSVAYLG